MAKKTTTLEAPAPVAAAPASEPTKVVLSWADDAPARRAARRDPSAPDTTQPTRDELADGQQAAELGLAHAIGDLEDVESLCRTLASNLDPAAHRHLQGALRVIVGRLEDIRFRLDEDSEAIVPLANLAAWYHRAVNAQGGAR